MSARGIGLDDALRALAPDVGFPPTPELRRGVAERRAAPVAEWRGWRWTRPVLLAAVITLLVAASAVALAWALPGLRIVPVASVPGAPTLGTDLALGGALPPGEPQPFAVGGLGPADGAFVSRDGTVVTLVFAPRDGMPELGRGVGLLAQRVEGTLDVPMVMKLVEEVDARVVPISVDGLDGFWVTGPPHLVRYIGEDGREHSEMTRLAGDTLVWQDGEVLYRIESAIGLEASLRLAESVEDEGTGWHRPVYHRCPRSDGPTRRSHPCPTADSSSPPSSAPS
jgi:hypothetical protein